MATLTELIAAVRRAVKDPSYTDAEITALLNEGIDAVAAGVKFAPDVAPTPPLPELLTSSTVTFTASSNNTSLPTNYGRELIRAYDSDGEEVRIIRSWNRYLKDHPNLDDTGGTVSTVCLRGLTIYCQPIASTAQTITLHYYRQATAMASGTDEPDGLPDEYHRRVLVSYAAKEMYSDIEVSQNGRRPNTEKHEAKFSQALRDMFQFLEPSIDGEPAYVVDDGDYIDEW